MMSSSSSSASHLTSSINSLMEMIKFVQFKLNHTNYLFWRAQMEPILKGHDLFDHVDPDLECLTPPRQTLDPSSNTLIPNPYYDEWYRVDCLVRSFMYATITEPVFAQLIGFDSARQVWMHLETSFIIENTARVPELERQLSTLRKGNLSMFDYLSKIQGIINVLDFVGKCPDDDDDELVLKTYQGLGPEYHNFVTTMTARPNCPSFSQLHSLLMAEEIRLNYINNCDHN